MREPKFYIPYIHQAGWQFRRSHFDFFFFFNFGTLLLALGTSLLQSFSFYKLNYREIFHKNTVYREGFFPEVYDMPPEEEITKIITSGENFFLVNNITLVPIYHFGKHLSSKNCPQNIGVFHHKVVVRYLKNGQLFTDDGSVAEIFDKDFCFDQFYDPRMSEELYMSVLMCRNAKPVHRYAFSNETFPAGCQNSIDLTLFYRQLRFAYTICGFFSLIFLAMTLFLYLTLQGIN